MFYRPFTTLLLYSLSIFSNSMVGACEIQGTDSGFCESRYFPPTYTNSLGISNAEAQRRANTQWKNGTLGPCQYGQSDFCMPFCGQFISHYYIPCVPQPQPLPRDVNFPQGRFTHHTTRYKDRWVEETVSSMIQYKLKTSKQRRGTGFHNPDCREAFSRYFCYVNFPRCDDTTLDRSLPMCRSVCENFMRSCGFESDLWRCHEEPSSGEYVDPWTDFFPGQPFVDSKSRGSIAVCTPSIRGSASVLTLSRNVVIGLVVLSTLLIWR